MSTDQPPTMTADILGGRRRLWGHGERRLELTDVALRWEIDGARAAIPWSAVCGADAEEDTLVVTYLWPYAEGGTARVRFPLSSMSVFLVVEDVRRRLALATLPSQSTGEQTRGARAQ